MTIAKTKEKIYLGICAIIGRISTRALASHLHFKRLGRRIDWDSPADLNEKINWLKTHSDLKQWARMADKIAMREYAAERGCARLLPRLYGAWSDPRDIDFDSLPMQFALKTNHGCAATTIVTDRNAMDREKAVAKLAKSLRETYGLESAEPHYRLIRPRLAMAEELVPNDSGLSSTPIDYKVWCLGGKPHCVCACMDRSDIDFHSRMQWYDLEWQPLIEWDALLDEYRPLPPPPHLPEMIEAATSLSKGHPQLRVDFYDTIERPYLGELTLTCNGGYMHNLTHKALLSMGALIPVP